MMEVKLVVFGLHALWVVSGGTNQEEICGGDQGVAHCEEIYVHFTAVLWVTALADGISSQFVSSRFCTGTK